jgi:ABC-type nitrate/sulfonate/bicarbonate transport system substrate-binding protein
MDTFTTEYTTENQLCYNLNLATQTLLPVSFNSDSYRMLARALIFQVDRMQIALFVAAMLITVPCYALDSVTLQLKWTHAFQFAGYYAAKEMGYYRDAGLDVNIVEALPGIDPVKNVIEGKAEFGVGTSALLLERSIGVPVVVLAVIFQHSPYVLISRQTTLSQTIHDLKGKRIMLEPQANELLAYLSKEDIPLDSITQLPHSFNPQDLIDGKTDAIAGYLTNQPYYLDRAHFKYQIHSPRSAGIDFYGDNLFTTEQELRANPERVKAFLEASLKGWRFALDRPDEMANLIRAKYSMKHTRDYYLYEARQTIALIHPELIKVGYMNPRRWQSIADTYVELGMLPRKFSLDGFLYDPHPDIDLTWLYRGLAALLVLSIILGILFVLKMNRRLAVKVSSMQLELALSFEASQQLIMKQAATLERERIYHDLHDDVGAKLLSLTILAQRANLPKLADLSRSALQDLRDVVSRSAQASIPLSELLADWRAEKEKRIQAAGIHMEWHMLTLENDILVSAEAALNLSRILRESVSNTLRHAQASHITISTELSLDRFIMVISDNGIAGRISVIKSHRGLNGIRTRAESLGGELNWSQVEPHGFKVIMDVPIHGLSPQNAGVTNR